MWNDKKQKLLVVYCLHFTVRLLAHYWGSLPPKSGIVLCCSFERRENPVTDCKNKALFEPAPTKKKKCLDVDFLIQHSTSHKLCMFIMVQGRVVHKISLVVHKI